MAIFFFCYFYSIFISERTADKKVDDFYSIFEEGGGVVKKFLSHADNVFSLFIFNQFKFFWSKCMKKLLIFCTREVRGGGAGF